MRFSIAQKIVSVALIVLTLMVMAAAYSIKVTADISRELDTVVRVLTPLSDHVTRIGRYQLQKDIDFERTLVRAVEGAEVLDQDDAAEAGAKWDAEISEEISAAQSLLNGAFVKVDADDIPPGVNELRPFFVGLDSRSADLKDLRTQVLDALIVADLDTFNALFDALSAEQDALASDLIAMRIGIRALADAAVARADQNEKQLLVVHSVLTALAAVLGIGLAVVLTRVIVSAVKNLVGGTEAVENGDLDTEVAVTSQDEVGKLTQSFNRMVGELRLKERIKDTFGKYMDPRIVTNLLDNPEFTRPGGERREMTVMFIDLKGFTSISEALEPDALVALINRFFSHMTSAISDNQGVVDKFMGDAVMAYWGPPFTAPDTHAKLACKAAAEALRRLEEFRKEVAETMGPEAASLDVDLRIGISTGDMIVGTIGSTTNRSFTVTGDPVNLGSRLEGANKAYGTRVMLSEQTRAQAGAGVSVRELDAIRVKGKSEPVRVYELWVADVSPPELVDAVPAFERGLAAYRAQDWDAAAAAFRSCLSRVSDDPPSRVYLSRIDQLRDAPPADDWDGVWTFDTK